MKTNFGITPIKKILLRNLTDYTQIKGIFRRSKIDRYIYDIKYNGHTIKYGISHQANQQAADRIYTQIGHMPGWNKPLLKRSDKKTGKAIRDMMAKVSPNFHKNDVEIDIYDFTNYPFQRDDTVYAEMQNAEEELKEQYYQQFKKYPAGNIKQEGIRSIVKNEVLDQLFE